MNYTTVDFVKVMAQIKYDDLGFTSDAEYSNFIQHLIMYASALVDNYCGQSFSDPIPPAISYATALIVSRTLHGVLMRKINPTVHMENITIRNIMSESFAEEIKVMLEPYRRIEVLRG